MRFWTMSTKPKQEPRGCLGGSYNNTKTDNDTNQDMISENGYVNNEARSNHFVYEENIIGLYATLELTMNEKFSTKVGTRFENTNSEGECWIRRSDSKEITAIYCLI
ncbi:MAG: outer membrane beta-barrel protein [Saprospiraceae bacterium]|nr:outer membrane beta-barrel protein [Candidatus Brachybacter algidus]